MGTTVFSTVTIASQVALLPLSSVMVRITVLSPRSAQVKSVISKVGVAVPQLSVEPLFISSGVMVTEPVASSCTVIS